VEDVTKEMDAIAKERDSLKDEVKTQQSAYLLSKKKRQSKNLNNSF